MSVEHYRADVAAAILTALEAHLAYRAEPNLELGFEAGRITGEVAARYEASAVALGGVDVAQLLLERLSAATGRGSDSIVSELREVIALRFLNDDAEWNDVGD